MSLRGNGKGHWQMRAARRLGWPDRETNRWEEVVLGEDEHGVWGCLPALAPMSIHNGDVVRFRYPLLFCYPRDRWWVAWFRCCSERWAEIHRPDGSVEVAASPEQIYVHMATPAAFTDEGVSFCDLVLDVTRMPDGTVAVLDEDELDEHVEKWAIPPDAVAGARAACEEVARLLRDGGEPFGEVWERWLQQFREGHRSGA